MRVCSMGVEGEELNTSLLVQLMVVSSMDIEKEEFDAEFIWNNWGELVQWV